MKQKILIGSLAFMSLCMLSGCKRETIQTYSHTDFAMGTVTNVTLYGTANEEKLKSIEEDLIEDVKTLEAKQISWRKEGSSIAKLNQESNKSSVKVSEPLYGWLKKSMEISSAASGKVDASIGLLTQAWDFESDAPSAPSETTIKNILKKVSGSYKRVKIKEDNTISTDNETKFDLGAFGKGIGTDQAYQTVKKKKEIKGAVISLGGSIAVYGRKEDSDTWNLGIQNPSGEQGEVLGSLKVKGGSFISTSGDYEKYFVDKKTGKRYFHILDENTGYSVKSDMTSCTIVCDSGIVSDGLSTACFALGPKKSQSLLKKYHAKAIFVDKNKNVFVSDGLDFTITDQAYQRKK